MQDIICSVTISSTVDPDSVELTWTNADSIITADNRVTILPTNVTKNPSSFTYTTVIQFAYLMEGDDGNSYTCNAEVDDVMKSHSILLENLRSMQIQLLAMYYTVMYMCGFYYSQYPGLLWRLLVLIL